MFISLLPVDILYTAFYCMGMKAAMLSTGCQRTGMSRLHVYVSYPLTEWPKHSTIPVNQTYRTHNYLYRVVRNMIDILTAGEILVEIMRKERDVSLWVQGDFNGPYPSGAVAIFIDQVALLGHSAAIAGAVGDDDFGHRTRMRLSVDGVDVSYVQVLKEATTAVAFVSYTSQGDRTFIYHIANAAAGLFENPPEEKLKKVKLFHVMGCSLMASKRMRDRINSIAEQVKASGGLVSFDPNIRVELLGEEKLEDVIGRVMDLTDILMPGETELLSITGKNTTMDAAEHLLSGNMKALVIKRGKEGALYMDDREQIEFKPFVIDEVDPTGAGDAFDAGFLCGYLEGLSKEQCLRLGSGCGALNASYFGPMEGVFPRSYVERFMSTR
jgi:sugar/nucleoside kinase (ribokinase family)